MLVTIIIGVVILAAFWRPILKIGIALLVIGFLFLLVSGLYETLHGLHVLIR
jgi:hypothetical protein